MDQTLFELFKPYLAGQLRHILTVLAGVLIAKGALSPADQGPFVTIASGIAFYVIGAGWSWWQKSGQAQALAAKDKALGAFKKPPAASLTGAAV